MCLASFSDRRLRELRRALGPNQAWSLGPRDAFRLFRASALRGRFTTAAAAVQVPVSFRGVQLLTPRFVTTAHDAGVEVHVWTIDDPVEMDRLLDLGVDGIMTDRPDLLRDVLRQRDLWTG